jgi:hypothetical protein
MVVLQLAISQYTAGNGHPPFFFGEDGFLINPPAFDRMNIMANGNIDESASLPEYLASVEVEDEEITSETAARLDRARASNESIPHDDILREFDLKKLSSEEPQRIGVTWTPQGQADLRAIDRENAIGILHCLDRYLKNREGDVKQLKPPRTDYGLGCAIAVCSLISLSMSPGPAGSASPR